MDIMALIKLTLQIWEAYHNCQIFPDVALLKLQCLTHQIGNSDSSSRSFSTLYTEHTLALETIKVLRETSTVGEEVVALYDKSNKGIDFIEGIEDAKEVSWMAMGRKSQEVAQRGWKQTGKLLFGKKLYKQLETVCIRRSGV